MTDLQWIKDTFKNKTIAQATSMAFNRHQNAKEALKHLPSHKDIYKEKHCKAIYKILLGLKLTNDKHKLLSKVI